ncbi:MAG: PAS domain S-box protein, partial [Bacteroidota bacterium]
MQSDLGLYRVLAVMTAVALPSFRFILPADSFDPMWLRLALSGVFLSLFIASFVLPFVRRHVVPISYTLIYLLCFWVTFLAYENKYGNQYLSNYLIVLLCSAVSFKDPRNLVAYSIVNVVLAIAAMMFWPGEMIYAWGFLGLVTFTVTVANFSLAFRVGIQEEVKRQRKIINSVFDSSPDAIFLATTDWEVQQCNRGAMRIFAFDGDPDDLHEYLQTWLREFQKGKETIDSQQEVLLRRMDGQEFWANVAMTQMEANDQKMIMIRVLDISEQKKVEETLQMSADILKEVNHLIVVRNSDGSVIYVSPSVQHILGYAPEDLMGEAWWKTQKDNPELRAEEKEYVKRCSSGKIMARSETYEREIIAQNGEAQWMLWKDSCAENGQVISVGILNTSSRKNAFVRSAIFDIAEFSTRARSPEDFYEKIHEKIREVVNTPN